MTDGRASPSLREVAAGVRWSGRAGQVVRTSLMYDVKTAAASEAVGKLMKGMQSAAAINRQLLT